MMVVSVAFLHQAETPLRWCAYSTEEQIRRSMSPDARLPVSRVQARLATQRVREKGGIEKAAMF